MAHFYDMEQRLKSLVLGRSVSMSITSIVMFASISLIAHFNGSLTKFSLSICSTAWIANFFRLPLKYKINSKNIDHQMSLFTFLTYSISILWSLNVIHLFYSFGLTSEVSDYALLITAGIMAGVVSILSPIPNLVQSSIAIMGLCPGVSVLLLAKTPSDYVLFILLIVFSSIMVLYSKEYYRTLRSAEERVNSKNLENQTIKSLLNAVPGYMSLLDKDLNYIMANDALTNRLSVPINGRKLGFTGDDETFRKLVEDFASSDQMQLTSEIRLGSVFEKEHYLLSLTRLEQQESNFALLTINIEDYKKAQKSLEEAKLESEHNSRLIALGEMISSVAHEIRNPLSIISGRASLIEMNASKNSLSSESAIIESKNIRSMVERIEKIIQTVLAFSRNDTVKVSACRLNAILEEAVFLISAKVKVERVELEIQNELHNDELECNPLQISQVLVNLITNAVDAISKLEKKWIQVSLKNFNDHIQIKVTDSGLGIPSDIQVKLMTPFFTTKAKGRGTGLGLSISKGIVERHNGSLVIDDSAPNTTFVVTLPRTLKKVA